MQKQNCNRKTTKLLGVSCVLPLDTAEKRWKVAEEWTKKDYSWDKENQGVEGALAFVQI